MTIDSIRRCYAEKLSRIAGVQLAALNDAFARVPRERFLPAGPWKIIEPPPTAPSRAGAQMDSMVAAFAKRQQAAEAFQESQRRPTFNLDIKYRETPLRPGISAEIQALCVEPHDRTERCLVHIDGFCLHQQCRDSAGHDSWPAEGTGP